MVRTGHVLNIVESQKPSEIARVTEPAVMSGVIA